MNRRPPRPEHRAIDPYADDVVDLQAHDPVDAKTELQCTECKPFRTKPVRYDDDPDTVVRCAQCGKRHSTDSLEVDV